MKQIAFVVFVVLGYAGPAAAQKLSDEEIKDGYVSLFNGKDWSGWQFGGGWGLPDKVPANWTIKDGVIHLTGGGAPHLGTQWDYEDFEFRLQWRAVNPKGNYNSGVYIRSGRKVNANQLNLAKGGEAGPVSMKIKGAKAVPDLQKPQGEWNEWKVRCVGDTVKLWCNDKLAWEATEFKDRKGYLGLQAEGAAMEFRNLRVKEIGWESLNANAAWKDFDATGWKRNGDALAAGSKVKPLVTAKNDFKDYVLRLEWKSLEGMGIVGVRGLSAEEMWFWLSGIAKDAKTLLGSSMGAASNPLGQWNYLEIRVVGNTASVRQNGKMLRDNTAIPAGVPVAEAISLHRCDDIMIRNVRVQEIKK